MHERQRWQERHIANEFKSHNVFCASDISLEEIKAQKLLALETPAKGCQHLLNISAFKQAHGRALTLCMTIHRLPLTNPQSPSYTSSTKRRHADLINPPPPLFPSVLSAATSEVSVQTDSSLILRHQGVVLSCLAQGCILNVKKPEILVHGVQSNQLTVHKPAPLHTILPQPPNIAEIFQEIHKHMNNLVN